MPSFFFSDLTQSIRSATTDSQHVAVGVLVRPSFSLQCVGEERMVVDGWMKGSTCEARGGKLIPRHSSRVHGKAG